MILDTNALSAFADGHREIRPYVESSEIVIPVVVLGEYRYGISHSVRRIRYEAWLNTFLPAIQVLEINRETALWYSQIRSELRHAGKLIPANDVWIAALSKQHSLPILSRDRHFDQVKGLQRIGW
ncbi:MAG: type II toxin-antitoxin system VapC family toxin [Acidobacteriota bacterium]